MVKIRVYLLTQLKGDTPLIQACAAGQQEMAAFLLKHGAAIDYVNMVRLLYVHCGHSYSDTEL
jgi:ankyrin repeat protein